MKNEAKVKEVVINIDNKFVVNLIYYFTIVENYVYVGTSDEIWLENLSHPHIQVIHIHSGKKFTEARAAYAFKKTRIVSDHIKKTYLMMNVDSMIFNVEDFDSAVFNNNDNPLFSHVNLVNVEDESKVDDNSDMKRYFPKMNSEMLNREIADLMPKMHSDSKEKVMAEVKATNINSKPMVTIAFSIVLVCLFVYFSIRSMHHIPFMFAIHYGANYGPLIVAGEYHRLIASAFLHFELIHLVINLILLYQIGSIIENVFGKWRMIFLIFIGAIMGNLFNFAFTNNFSIGSSTVVYAFMGALFFLGFEMRKIYMALVKNALIPMLVISTIVSLFLPKVDHWGHLGGFVGGFLAASTIGVMRYKPFVMRSLLAFTTVVILAGSLFVHGRRFVQNSDYDHTNRLIIKLYLEQGYYERAAELKELFAVEYADLDGLIFE